MGTSSSANTDKTIYSFAIANDNQDAGFWYGEFLMTFAPQGKSVIAHSLFTTTSSYLAQARFYCTAGKEFQAYDGSDSVYGPAGVLIAANTPFQFGLVYSTDDAAMALAVQTLGGATDLVLNLDGTYGTEGTYDGSFFGTPQLIRITEASASTKISFGIRNFRRYDIPDFATGKTTLDGLMP